MVGGEDYNLSLERKKPKFLPAWADGGGDFIRIQPSTRGQWHRFAGLHPDSPELDLIAVDLRLAPSGAGHEQIRIVPGLKSASGEVTWTFVGMSDK